MKRIVITGASGMIGSRLAGFAAKKSISVKAIIRKNSLKRKNVPVNDFVEIIECDNDHLEDLIGVIAKPCDVFFHFGWEGTFGDARNDAKLQEKNVRNTLRAIDVSHKLSCKKFIFAGSQAEFGLQNEPLRCNTLPNPITCYGIAKNTAFLLGRILASKLGMELCSGRILSAYGENDNLYTMISATLLKMISGEVCDLSPCTQIWDYIYVDDVVNAFYSIAERGVAGKAYPVGSGTGKPLKEYVETMYEVAGNKKAKLNYGAIALRSDAVKYLVADIGELTEDTGFIPNFTFRQGIEKTVAWLNKKQ